MQVKLNIEEDNELRLYIKDCIRNVIKELVELTKQVITQEIDKKLDYDKVNNLIKNEVLKKATLYGLNLKQLIQKEVHDQCVLELYGYNVAKNINLD